MAKHHIDREELKKDEVAETIQTLIEDFNRNRTAILATIGAVVLAFAVWTTLSRRSEAAALENTKIFTTAHQSLATAAFSKDDAERNKELQTAIDSLQTLVEKRGSSEAGRHALYLQGNCYYAMDDYAQAQAKYEKYVAGASSNDDRARGAIAVGQAIENQSFMDQTPDKLSAALEQYEKAASEVDGGSYLHFQALMNQGRILELQEKDDQAIAIYKQVVDLRPVPREKVPGAPEETERKNAPVNSFVDQLIERAEQGAKQLSFRAQAQERLDQLQPDAQPVPDASAPANDAAASAADPAAPEAP